MKIRTTLILLTLAWSQLALAERELVTLVEATETSPSNIILPASTNGMMTFRPCAEECDATYERARLTPQTRFVVNGEVVKFEDFRIDLANERSSEDALALVSVDVQSSTVTSIDLTR